MHLVFYARGIEQQIYLWKIAMMNAFFVWDRVNLKTNNIEKILVQGALRPSVLGAWEYIFPKEALPEVLSMMGLTDKSIGVAENKRLLAELQLLGLRKLFGCKKIPKEAVIQSKKYTNSLIINDRYRGLSNLMCDGVSIHPIGIKEDITDNLLGYRQEML